MGQLTRANNVAANYTVFYHYDNSGNMVSSERFDYADAPTWHMESLAGTGIITTYTYNNSTWGDMLGVYSGKIILYDEIGNPTNWRNATNLTWEGRELQGITLSGADWLTYTYNSSGIRTKKVFFNNVESTFTTHSYTLDGSTIIRESVTGPTAYTLDYLYDASGRVQGFIYNNKYYYFQKNLQGDVIRILNSNGTVVTEYTYDAWGNVLTITGSLASTVGRYNPFRYRGYYYDAETGWYYLQSRYYDPTVGRFLNADGIIGANGGIEGYNLFVYCSNNSVMYIDSNGYCKTMWENGQQGPCPGPGKCQDFDYDAYYEHQLETTGVIQSSNGNTGSAPPKINTFTNDETPSVSSLDFSVFYDSSTSASSIVLTYFSHNPNISYTDELVQLTNATSDVVSGIGGGIIVGIDVFTGMYRNLKNDASFEKFAYDACVDTVVSGGGVLLSMYVSGAVGTAFCPVLGTVAGIAVSVAWYLLFDKTGLRDEIKGWVS